MSEEYQGSDEYAPLVCELWFPTAMSHDNPLLRTLLEDEFEHVGVDAAGISLTHEELVNVTEDGVPGWGSTLVTSRTPDVLPNLEQTWAWPEASDALKGCRGVLVLTERLQSWVSPERRVEAFNEVLRTIVDATLPVALWWPNADVVTRPEELGETLLGYFNVRRVRSAEAADGWVVDTYGLQGLNIPDLECHFRGMDIEWVSDLLTEHAHAFIEGTEFIGDGDPVVVPGIGPDDGEVWFTARWVSATVPPLDRRVVAFVPPPELALGSQPEPEDDDEDD